MSLFDLIASGVKVTNLDGTEADVAAIAEETKDEEVAVEQGAGEEPAAVEPEAAEGEAAPASEEATEATAETTEAAAEETAEPVAVEEDAAGDEVVIADADELNTALLEVQEEEAEYHEGEESVEEAEEAAVSTESLLKNLYAAKALGGMGIAHAELANEHVRYVGKSLGMSEAQLPAMAYSQESFSSAGAIALTTEGAIQSVKDFFVRILNAILDGIAWIIDKGRALWNKLFANFDKLKKYVESIKEAASAAKGKTLSPDVKISRSLALNLVVDGKKESPTTCITLLSEAVKEVAASWDARKLGEIGKKLAEETEMVFKTAKAKELANEAGKQIVDDVIATVPFSGGRYTVGNEAAAKAGVKLGKDWAIKMSDELPRNKRVLVALNLEGNGVRAGVVSTNFKQDGEDVKLANLGIATIEKDLGSLLGLIDKMMVIRKKLDEASNAAKVLQRAVSSARKQYLAVSKTAREGKGFIENNQAVRARVTKLKDILTLLREPATSFSSYFLYEVKGLADIYKAMLKGEAAEESKSTEVATA